MFTRLQQYTSRENSEGQSSFFVFRPFFPRDAISFWPHRFQTATSSPKSEHERHLQTGRRVPRWTGGSYNLTFATMIGDRKPLCVHFPSASISAEPPAVTALRACAHNAPPLVDLQEL
ncbi:unnamed protein product [Ectocarpus sp. 13 AM-2016]